MEQVLSVDFQGAGDSVTQFQVEQLEIAVALTEQ